MSNIKWRKASPSSSNTTYVKVREIPKEGVIGTYVATFETKYGSSHKLVNMETGMFTVVNGSASLDREIEGVEPGQLIKIDLLGKEELTSGPNKGGSFFKTEVSIAEDVAQADVSKYL